MSAAEALRRGRLEEAQEASADGRPHRVAAVVEALQERRVDLRDGLLQEGPREVPEEQVEAEADELAGRGVVVVQVRGRNVNDQEGRG